MEAAKNDVERAKDLALASMLDSLAAGAQSNQVKVQAKRAASDLKSGKRNRRYTLLRILRILRILMSIVPG